MLGWAATGKNREGTGFVVPLAMSVEPYITLYLAQETGVSRFDWKSNRFDSISNEDIRDQIDTGQHGEAIWIYVIDKEKLPDNNMNFAYHTIGAMSENQYLVADQLNVGVRFIDGIDKDKIASVLKLDNKKQLPASILVMSGN